MGYKVYISHSTAKQGLLAELHYWLDDNGMEAHVGLLAQRPEAPLKENAREALEHCDWVLVFVTADGTRQGAVNQEVAHALRFGRPVISIVEVGVPLEGLLAGSPHVAFDPVDPEAATRQVGEILHYLPMDKETRIMARGAALYVLGLLALADAVASVGDPVRPS